VSLKLPAEKLSVLQEMGRGKPLIYTRNEGWWVGFTKIPLGSVCRALLDEGYIDVDPKKSDEKTFILTAKGRAVIEPS
jgi:hypothetical protein